MPHPPSLPHLALNNELVEKKHSPSCPTTSVHPALLQAYPSCAEPSARSKAIGEYIVPGSLARNNTGEMTVKQKKEKQKTTETRADPWPKNIVGCKKADGMEQSAIEDQHSNTTSARDCRRSTTEVRRMKLKTEEQKMDRKTKIQWKMKQ